MERVRKTLRKNEGENTHRFTQNNTKKIPNRKTPSFGGIHEFCFKKSPPSMTDKLSKWINAYQKQTYPNGWPKERPHWTKKSIPQRNRPKQLQAHNVPTYDVEDTNGTNTGRDLRLANKLRIVSRKKQRCCKKIQRRREAILNRSTHPQRMQDETEKSMTWIDYKKAYIMVPQS